MKFTKIAILAIVLAFTASLAKSQTFKADYATSLTLAGNAGTDPINSLKIYVNGDPSSPLTWKLPNNNGSGGNLYYLQNDGAGNLTWANAATPSLQLGNDSIFIGNASRLAVAEPISGDVSMTNLGVMTVNSASGPKFTVLGNDSVGGTETVTGAVTDASTLNVIGSVALDSTTGSGGTNTIGNTTSTTNFYGTLNFPAGTVKSSSLSLGNDSLLIGYTDGDAHVRFISQDVSIGNTGIATVNGSHATNFSATGSESVTGAVNLDTTTGSGGTNNIGNTTSTTNFYGTLNFPAGTVKSSSLSLGNDSLLIGYTDGDAHVRFISQDVSIGNTGIATVNGSHATNFSATGSESVTGAVNLDTTTGSGGTNNIGNTTSTTNFYGTLNFPAGTVKSSSLSLGNDSLLIGYTDGDAHVRFISQDVSIGNTGIATVNGSHATNFSATGSESVTGAVNLDTTTGSGGTNNIGNTTSTTNFYGTLNFPAGTVKSSSLSLGNDSLLIGYTDGDAHARFISQDVSIGNTGIATVNSSNATTFAVAHAETVAGTLGVTGQTTLGSTGLAAPATIAVSSSTLALNSINSYFILSSTVPETVTSITGANVGTVGQIIVLFNSNTSAANYITLTSGGTLLLNGSNVILGAGGTATLISNGTNWRLLSAQ